MEARLAGFLSGLAEDMSAVTVVLVPASGYFIPDDPALLDMADNQFRGFTEISMQSKVDAMRTQSMAYLRGRRASPSPSPPTPSITPSSSSPTARATPSPCA